ncbi:MAG: ATP-binding cassette domain-containing protein [Desulfovibrio sp.]|nr:ATP-binding cassette domain-containing protein [Desulfovibrio sp.]
MTAIIQARDLYKCYPGFPPVLRGVNIDVQPGEMAAIMGPSGCGKSTMLHILGMLHRPDSGSLEILGENVLAFTSEQTAAFRRGNMGFVMQASNLFEHSTVFENVEFPLIYENVPPQERWERVIRALELVRLSSRVHYRSNRLSGGEQQRVAIARAMVNNPRILLADEPTGALDARTSAVVMENFSSLCHNGGVAMVMVTHDPKMAEYCDSIYTLEEGVLHCKKHQPPKVAATSAAGFLKMPEPLVRGALVARHFPAGAGEAVLELSRRMHAERLLARIYSLGRGSLLASQNGYSLPLAVRHLGFWQRFFGQGMQAGADRSALRKLRADASAQGTAQLAARRNLNAGAVLYSWATQDEIEVLYAAGSVKVAAATWACAQLAQRPFAFAVSASDLSKAEKAYAALAKAAAFMTCSTPALAAALRQFLPPELAGKILVLPNPPLYASGEEDAENSRLQPGKQIEIVLMPRDSGRAFFYQALLAAVALRKSRQKFHITCLGSSSWALRCRLWLKGLRRHISFTGRQAADSLAETFRNADIFVGWPMSGPGMNLLMPWPVSEAMAFAKAIIVLGLTEGMQPLKAGANCLVADSGAGLAGELGKLMGDHDLARKLGAAARADIWNFLDIRGSAKSLADHMVEAAAKADRNRVAGK